MIYPNFFHGLIEGRQHCGKYKFLSRAHITARATGTSMIAGSTDWGPLLPWLFPEAFIQPLA